MKVWELASGIMTPLTNEEDDLLLKLIVDEKVKLSEREEIVAQQLTQKNALIREETETSYIFKVNFSAELWKD